MKKHLLSLLLCIPFLLNANNGDSFIINISEGNIPQFIKQYSTQYRAAPEYKVLSKDLDIILIPNAKGLEKLLKKSVYVESYGADAKISIRKESNDPLYSDQWGLFYTDIIQAWDITTGGTFDGKHEVVIAVLDDGFEIQHEDLIENIYINKGETPDNNIDDDNNGYVDDYYGLNIETGNDKHPQKIHGTSAAGIIGARGNNGLGVSGIMWKVKILPISEVSRQSELIETFQYLINLRRAWNDSNGEEGSFIVANNYSAGIDNAFGTDPQYKSWCDMYDKLGEVGILSIGSTANIGVDVDVEGDMPSTCQSDYLIAVTNSGKDDQLVPSAGYGVVNIDLSAPGGTRARNMPSLGLNNTFSGFDGTSCAAPHVAGGVGLIYSMDCPQFVSRVYESPAQTALLVKNAILNGVDQNTSVRGKVKSNGRLNIHGAMQQVLTLCPDGPQEDKSFTIENIEYKSGNTTVSVNIKETSDLTLAVYDSKGSFIREVAISNPTLGTTSVSLGDITLPAGMYYFSIYNEKEISTKTLFVSK